MRMMRTTMMMKARYDNDWRTDNRRAAQTAVPTSPVGRVMMRKTRHAMNLLGHLNRVGCGIDRHTVDGRSHASGCAGDTEAQREPRNDNRTHP
jgi:hypothetical protein